MTDDVQAQGLIPDRLLSNIKQKDLILFWGADLPLGYEGAPASHPELAAALAAEFDLPPGCSWRETADAYLAKFANDVQGLRAFVRDHCCAPRRQPGPIHQAIARTGFRAIVTTWYDDLLEQALRDAGCRVHRVVRDLELLYGDESQRDVTVVKLLGSADVPDSLVLTSREHIRLIGQLPHKLRAIISFATLRPLLFVGHDLTDPILMALYEKASEGVVEHMRRAYAVWPQPSETMRAAWLDVNLEFLDYQPAPFLQALAAQLPAGGAAGRRAIRVRRPPYKFLDYYEAEDADIFCGRDTESQIVTRLALSHPLLTLFGPSGVGKTSLLLAGVVPRLAAEGYQPVYMRALDDPLLTLRRAVAARAGRAEGAADAGFPQGDPRSPEEEGEALRLSLEDMLAAEDKLVIILDQFEELFLRVGSSQRARFFGALAAVLARRTREVRFVFSLREDYLPHLDDARPDLPDVFANIHRLTALDRPNARVAITEPAVRAGVTVEAALVDALVGGEGRERGWAGEAGEPAVRAGDLVEAGGHVPPAALQIVLDYLYRDALPAGHAPEAPPPPGLALTLARYRAVRHRQGRGEEARELRGAEAILAGYVEEGLARLVGLKRGEGQAPLGADPALGREILKVMVTSQATKAALSQAEMADLLDQAGAIQGDRARDRVRGGRS